MVTPEGLGGRAQLTSHPPVLLQLPGGYKHGDLSVSPVPEILHRHGNAPAGEEVLETVPGGGVGVRGTNEGATFCPRNGPASARLPRHRGDEGLPLLHGLEANLATSLQTLQEA